MKAKETLVQKSVFLKPPTNFVEPLIIFFEVAHTKINKEVVAQILISQAAIKAPGLDKINFQILQMIQDWDKARITSMVYYAI